MENIKKIKDIGEIVKKRRKDLGLLQADSAGLLGVGVRFLSELERGKETLACGKVLAVLDGLGLELKIGLKEEERGE